MSGGATKRKQRKDGASMRSSFSCIPGSTLWHTPVAATPDQGGHSSDHRLPVDSRQASGFTVLHSVFRVQGSGFRFKGSGLRVEGSGLRFRGSGLKDSGVIVQVLSFGGVLPAIGVC